jgi:hypothetical protein
MFPFLWVPELSPAPDTSFSLLTTETLNWLNQQLKLRVRVKVTLRLAVYRQSVRLGVKSLETHDQRFFQESSCSHSPYVTPSLTKRWVCLLWICLAFRQVYVSHIQHVTENSCFCTLYKSSVSTVFAKQIMSILRILCYNGSLVTWTVVSLTTAKFKPLIFSTKNSSLSQS